MSVWKSNISIQTTVFGFRATDTSDTPVVCGKKPIITSTLCERKSNIHFTGKARRSICVIFSPYAKRDTLARVPATSYESRRPPTVHGGFDNVESRVTRSARNAKIIFEPLARNETQDSRFTTVGVRKNAYSISMHPIST